MTVRIAPRPPPGQLTSIANVDIAAGSAMLACNWRKPWIGPIDGGAARSSCGGQPRGKETRSSGGRCCFWPRTAMRSLRGWRGRRLPDPDTRYRRPFLGLPSSAYPAGLEERRILVQPRGPHLIALHFRHEALPPLEGQIRFLLEIWSPPCWHRGSLVPFIILARHLSSKR